MISGIRYGLFSTYRRKVLNGAPATARRPAHAAAIIDVQEGAQLEQQTRWLTWSQLRAEAQALNPQAKSPSKINTPTTSPGAAS
jgi:hypothetical protein